MPVPFDELSSMKRGESSADIRRRVVAARELQARRFAGRKRHTLQRTDELSPDIALLCREPEVAGILRQAMVKFDMSARATTAS